MQSVREKKSVSEQSRLGRGRGGGSRKTRLLRNLARLVNYDLFEHMQWAQPEKIESILAPEISTVAPDVHEPKQKPTLRSGELPPVEELYRLFDLYNAIHFDNTLPAASIEYSTRMLAAGYCEPLRRRIKIGVRYHQIFREELEDTLKHEMIHLIHYRHDKRFKAKAAGMGVSIHAKFHPALKRAPRYLYHCPVCKAQYPRQRRLRETSCGSCSSGAFDPRFKLLLIRKAPSQ